MLKWMGAALLAAAAIWAGRYCSQSVTLRRRALEAMVEMTGRAEDEIRFSGIDVCTLVGRLSRTDLGRTLPFLQPCARMCGGGAPFPDAWQKALDQTGREMRLTEEDLDQLASFGARLGATDLEGQLAHCRLHGREFARLLEQAREQERTKGKLYRSLSLLASAAVAILAI